MREESLDFVEEDTSERLGAQGSVYANPEGYGKCNRKYTGCDFFASKRVKC
jgi:hypothetical protein